MRRYLLATLILVGLAATAALALVMTEDKGAWPDSWPKELDSLRSQAKTVRVAHGIQEDVFEISFKSAEELARAWPHILTLKSPGAPLIIEKGPSTYSRSGSTLAAGIRVLWPSGGWVELPDGTKLTASAPWPDSARLPSGDLPEYVTVSDKHWVPHTGGDPKGFLHRARVDIMLVADGKVVDLNKIPLPHGVLIDDRRFAESAPASH